MNKDAVIILTHRDLNAGGGASYRIIHLAKQLSNHFKVYVLDVKRNTGIIVEHGILVRKKLSKSYLAILLSLIHSVLSRLLVFLGLPREEVGRISSVLDFGILIDAIYICKRVKPFLILVEEFYSLAWIALLLKKIFKIRRIILDLHNIDSFRLLRYPDVSSLFVKLIHLMESFACKISDLIIVVSLRDYLIAKKMLIPSTTTQITIVPNFVAYSDIKRVIEHQQHLRAKNSHNYVIFHGDFRYYPNREALLLLLNYVMPAIWKKYPNIKLIIAGPGLPKYEGKQVISLGFLPQERLYIVIRNALCAIVPLLRGGGSRIKILEYMACGIPVISTKIGAEGLEVKSYEHIILVENFQEIPSAFEMILKDRDLRARLIHNSITLIKNKYDVTKVAKKLIKMCKSMISEAQIHE